VSAVVDDAKSSRALGELPAGWSWVRLGDVCDAINGRAFKSTEWRDTGLPIIRIQNLKDAGAEFNYFDGALDNRHRVSHGDLLFAWSGTPGTSFGAHIWKGSDAALNQHIFNIKFDQQLLDTRYFCLALNQNVSRYVAQAQGGVGLAHITKSKFLDSFIPFAPKAKQLELVAEIEKQFSRLDEAVANLKRVRANLKRYRAAILNDAVSGWPVQPLGMLLREPLRNGHSAKFTPDPNGLRAFTLSAVTEGDFSEANTKRTVADSKKVADLWAEPGDIYVERSNTPELVGTARLYRGPRNFAFIPDLLIRVRVSNAVLPEYAEIALQSDKARQYFRSKAQGIAGSMPKIDQAVVESFPLPLPAPLEQHRVVAEVDRRMSIAREVQAEVGVNLKRAQALRQAVLTRAFGPAMNCSLEATS
jgi:type I restriction enzyme S subunit